MNDDQFGNSIRKILDQSLDDKAIPTRQLRAARERALAAFDAAQVVAEPVPLAALAGMGRRPSPAQGGSRGVLVRVILPAAIVLAAILGWQQWQSALHNDPEIQGLGRIDAELLKSDLPVDALIDPDFKAYLQKVRTTAPAEGTAGASESAGAIEAAGRSER